MIKIRIGSYYISTERDIKTLKMIDMLLFSKWIDVQDEANNKKT